MAERKRPETRPQLAGVASEHDKRRHTSAMTEQQLNNVLRYIRTAAAGGLVQLRAAADENMKRLRLHRDVSQASTGPVPAGSDQSDIRSVMEWMNKIKRRDRSAEGQLLTIHATLVTRG